MSVVSPQTFLSRFTILYGTSGLGKTTAARFIVWMIRSFLLVVYVHSGSDDTGNDSFNDISPDKLIFNSVDTSRLVKIVTKQGVHAKRCRNINKVGLMGSLAETMLVGAQKTAVANALRTYELHKDKCTDKELAELNARMLQHFHRIINTTPLDCISPDLREKVQTVRIWLVKYKHAPCIGIVVDDCADDSTWASSDIMKTLAYKARHWFITVIVLDQAQSMPTDIRGNAHNHIFMNNDALQRTLTLKSTGIKFSRQEAAMSDAYFRDAQIVRSETRDKKYGALIRFKEGATVHLGLFRYDARVVFERWVLADEYAQLFAKPTRADELSVFLTSVRLT